MVTTADPSADVMNNNNNNNNTNSHTSASNSGANKDTGFECNICLETAHDAVVSMCGHLFCWPCLHQWIETRINNPTCPVCKAVISKEKVVPLYGRNAPQKDPRENIPPRPSGQRQEPRRNRSFGLGDGVNFQMSFGVGAFPFGLFTTFNLNNSDEQPQAPAAGTPERAHHEF
ncbi:unnamed protein product, partial [Didymodactylos carnosus]